MEPISIPAEEGRSTTESASSQPFDATWSPSKSSALDADSLQISKRPPRAWERAPHSPAAEESRFKTVWKRYDLRSQHAGEDVEAHEELQGLWDINGSPERAVKKLRVKSPQRMSLEVKPTRGGRYSSKQFVATKWDRRRSVVARKRPGTSLEERASELADEENPASSDEELISQADEKMEEPIKLPKEVATEIISAPFIEAGCQGKIEETDNVQSPQTTTPAPDQLASMIVENEQHNVAPEPLAEYSGSNGSPHEDGESPPSIGRLHDALANESDQQLEIPPLEDENDSTTDDNTVEYNKDDANTGTTSLKHCPIPAQVQDREPKISSETLLDKSDWSPLPSANEVAVEPLSNAVADHPLAEDSEHADMLDADLQKVTPQLSPADITAGPPAADDKGTVESSHTTAIGCVEESNSEAMQEMNVPEESLAEMNQGETVIIQSKDENSTQTPKAPIAFPQNPDQNIIGPSISSPRIASPTQECSRTPSPVEDATCTVTLNLTDWMHLEDDRAVLTSFLDRAAANKANKVNVSTVEQTDCHRRESIQSRRDSDCVRQALASPRQPLGDKDGNLFSPLKQTDLERDGESPLPRQKFTEDVVSDTTLIMPSIDELIPAPETSRPPSPRRTGRTRSGRIHTALPTKISVRGNDPLVLTKTEAQELTNATRRNTRKNKGNALSTQDRLVQWRAELAVMGKDGLTPEPKEVQGDQKGIRWSEHLYFFNTATGLSEAAPLLDNAQPVSVQAVEDKLTAPAVSTSPAQAAKMRSTKSQTSRIRRLRGLGAANGTPAKGLLASTMLPDEAAEAAEEAATGTKEKAKPSEKSADATEPKTRKSRLVAPKKLALTPSVTSVAAFAVEGKENVSRPLGPKKVAGSAPGKKQVSLLPMPSTGESGGVASAAATRGGRRTVL